MGTGRGKLNVAIVMSSLVAVLSACGGGGGGGGKGTTINGRIQNAGAQTITVDALVNGEIVDSDTTDSGGRFELKVREESSTEDVRLVFDTAPILTLDILTIQNSEVSLVLSLAPDVGEVAVDTFQISTEELSCQNDESFSYIEPLVTTMAIDGGGSKSCIHTQDDCRFVIEIGGRLNVEGCSDGVLAENASEVRLSPGNMSSLNIDVGGNGIRGTNDSSVIATGFDVDITANDFGISANKNAFVQISVPVIGTCNIDGRKGAVDSSNAAIVDIGECRTS